METEAPRTEKQAKQGKDFLALTYEALPKRRIKEAVCRSHGYGVAYYKGRKVQVANYIGIKGEIVAQKIKAPPKVFSVLGNSKLMGLWQAHRWKPGSRYLIITEGETDCLAYQSVAGDKFPAVSLPNGAQSAKGAIRKHLEYVESFEQVVLYFDADEAGQKAAQEVAEMLTPGKARIARVPNGHKDIGEAVAAGEGEAVVKAFWEAQPFRPDGVIGSSELLQAVLESKTVHSTPYPWAGLNAKLLGLRLGELVTLTAGTGIGKSQICRALAWHLIQMGHTIGYIALEESLARTGYGLLEQVMGKPLHLGRGDVTDEDLEKVFDEHLKDKVVVFQHFGSMDAEHLLSKIKFMRSGLGCSFIIVDHLSILVSGWGDGDERRLIDNVMTALRSLVERTGVGMILVSHLKRAEGKPHEEGARPRLADLRGSQSIGQLSDAVIAISRNQQAEDPNLSEITVLKNRFVGLTGSAGYLRYDPETGLLAEDAGPEAGAEDYGF